MSKRTAKKQISVIIASAIEKLMLMPLSDEQLEARVNALFDAYEEAVTAVNAAGAVKGRSAVKKHFASIFASLHNTVRENAKA